MLTNQQFPLVIVVGGRVKRGVLGPLAKAGTAKDKVVLD